MTEPGRWVVIKIENPNATDPFLRTIYKVFASWTGGYLDGDSWRMNSGIDRITEDETTVNFYGYSGSCYKCHKGAGNYSTGTSYTTAILDNFTEVAKKAGVTITIMPEDTDWLNELK